MSSKLSQTSAERESVAGSFSPRIWMLVSRLFRCLDHDVRRHVVAAECDPVIVRPELLVDGIVVGAAVPGDCDRHGSGRNALRSKRGTALAYCDSGFCGGRGAGRGRLRHSTVVVVACIGLGWLAPRLWLGPFGRWQLHGWPVFRQRPELP